MANFRRSDITGCHWWGIGPKHQGQPCFSPTRAPGDAEHARQGHALAGRGHPVIDATLTPLAGPRARAAAPLPEIVETDELSDPAFADWLRAAPPPLRWVAPERAFLSRVRRECAVQPQGRRTTLRPTGIDDSSDS